MATQTQAPPSTLDQQPSLETADLVGDSLERLDYPSTTEPRQIYWQYVFGIGGIHLLGLLALLPWFFSWTGVVVAILGHYLVGTLGIGVGYHRLLTHRGFACPLWLEHILSTLGVLSLQDSPARWVAIHRVHHQHSERQPDPHSPLVNFLWSHVGWLVCVNRDHYNVKFYQRYVPDLLRDPLYIRYERSYFWFTTYIISCVIYYLVGFGAGWLLTGELLPSVQFGASIMVWGCFVRTLSVWHATWSVNSLSHLFGYRRYETNDNSRNNWFVGLFATGEGWHNNHHADPVSAKHGHRWWEFDMTWLTIRFMEMVGLAWDVKRPRADVLQADVLQSEAERQ
jgi:stearoyl-CoA desaturase (delta-9 desaturase)